VDVDGEQVTVFARHAGGITEEDRKAVEDFARMLRVQIPPKESPPEDTGRMSCDHLWVAGGLGSDFICEHCGAREDMPQQD
jgi:hypothetical protein